MNTWYPWQLFVRKGEIVAPLGVCVLALLALLVRALTALRSVSEPVFLHYSVELGVDAIGSHARVAEFFLLGLAIVGVNTLWCNRLLLSDRAQARTVAYATVVLVGALCAFTLLTLRANGV